MDQLLLQNCVFLITILLVFIFLLWHCYNHVLYVYLFSTQDVHKYWNNVDFMDKNAGNSW